ncbi:MAG: EAL domain-containing protein [Acidobacteriota bacterium]
MTAELDALLASSPMAVIVYDADGRVGMWNAAAERLFGWAAAEVLGQPHPWHARSEAAQVSALQEYVRSGESAGDLELTRSRKDGSTATIRGFVGPLRDAGGRMGGMVEMAADIGQPPPAESTLQRILHRDALTGLPDRFLYREALQRAAIEAGRRHSQFAVIHMDVAALKTVNTSMGPAAGDQVLQALGTRLRTLVNEGDDVARIGGDEFAVILRNSPSAAHASIWAERSLERLSAPIAVDDREVIVHLRAGAALFPIDGEQPMALMQRADLALHRATDKGGDRCEFYSLEMGEGAAERLWMESALRKAMDNCELALHYQPKVDIASGRVVGMEALLRWVHPEKGNVSPGRFVPLAEETGLIVRLGEWVIRTACAQTKAWIEQGLPPVRIAVNLSVHQLKGRDVVEMLRTLLHETRLSPQYLEIEITESEIMRNAEENIRLLRALKDMGLGISIDDFGTGYSSLSYLRRFPIDTLKIDASFVSDITTEPENAAIASAIIALGHSLNMKVIAEGVETESQLGFLYKRGCDQIQGYYFSKALPAAEFSDMLRTGRTLKLSEGLRKSRERTVLAVDDEEDIRTMLVRVLSRQGYSVLTAPDAKTGFETLATNQVGVIISDHEMPSMTGIEFLSRVKDLYPETVRIILTGQFEIDVVMEAINRGAIFKFIPKPFMKEDLLEAVRAAFILQETGRGNNTG